MKCVMRKILSYVMIVLIALVVALNYHFFVFPNRFAPAGLNGICTMIQHIFHFSVGYMNLLINVPLAIVVYLLVSKTHALRSMVYTVAFSGFILLFEKVDLSGLVYATENGTSTILGPLTAGILTGACAVLLFKVNACYGGTEFVASIIHKYHPEVNFFWIIFALNVSVAAVSYFVYDFQIEPVLLCVMYSFASSAVRDKMAQSGRSAVRFEVVTDYPQEMSQELMSALHHGSTMIPVRGMYQDQERSMLVCVVNKAQVPEFIDIVNKYPNSFVAMSQVTQVIGNFKRLDSHGHQGKSIFDSGRKN